MLLDDVPANAETWAQARAFRLAAARGVRGVVAHSDPEPRTRLTAHGPETIFPGHYGTIYQAKGMDYLGKTRPRRLTMLPDGSVLHRWSCCGPTCWNRRKRQRIIFRDPARHLPVGDLKGIPKSVPSDLLAGLLDHATTPLGRLTVALAAVHAVPGSDILKVLTADVDLARGTLEIRRGLLRHTLYLEEFTHRLAAEWLAYRHHRWPASTNPHLLVSQKTALDPAIRPSASAHSAQPSPRG
ncbi:hypothetical protein OOK58_57220 [Streptomyces sp. NBC_01728]|uniref:hypothetical protein n=1 Tax=unclassified Streptomyces TaxID=2593676 RepID=UPI002251AB13|nr:MULTISPECIES: hypothetical protein [unclassified Streptomyces]MCX4460146.1 hypothetical protein [Streptomyces sp. NBC_01719]MCX4500523.1 hypothetical protein [Streptomyces sp. NBC_01728]